MRILSIIFVFLLIQFSNLISEEDWIAFPKSYKDPNLSVSTGLGFSKLPKIIGEDMVQQVPILNFDIRYGSYYDFSLLMNIKTVFITNHFSAGLMWSFDIGHWSFGLENSFAFWYGFAEFGGMDASASGFVDYPALNIGYNHNDLYISMKFDASYATLLNRKVGSISVDESKDKVTSVSASLNIEQPYLKNQFIFLGFKLNYSRYFYQSWVAFATNKSWLVIPEFQFGVNLW